MSYNVWPTFSGRGWSIKKRPVMKTNLQEAYGGAQFATQAMQYPLYEFDLENPYLSQADFSSIIGFYNQQGGAAIPFYLSVDNDSSVTNQAFGTTDGSTTQYQLTKSDGSYWSEPVQGLNGTPSIYANGTQVLATGTGTPPAPTLGQVAGGTKAARTLYVKVSYLSTLARVPGGGLGGSCESLPSAEASYAVSANNLLTISPPPIGQGISGWNIYIGTTAGSETLASSLLIGQSYTEPTGAIPSGAAPRTSDGTTFSVTAAGLVMFAGTPVQNVPLTWTGSYYYLVRFKDDDQIETNQMFSQMYEAKTITLRTAR